MERRPPEVTIVDPNGPDVPGDVLPGSHRRRRRPSRRHVMIITSAMVLLALVIGVTGWRRHVRHERDLDRDAIADVQLLVDFTHINAPDATVRLSVRSMGGLPVRLTQAQLRLPGYRQVPLDAQLYGGAEADLALPDTAPCGLGLLHDPTSVALRLRVRTARGDAVTYDAPLTPDAVQVVMGTARARCGYLPPDHAFLGDVTASHSVGRAAVLDLSIRNQAVLPLRLLGLDGPPGLALSFSEPLPYTIPGTSHPGSATVIVKTLRLRVTSCAELLASLGGGSRALASARLLTARVANAGGTAQVRVGIEMLSGIGNVGRLPPAIDKLLNCRSS